MYCKVTEPLLTAVSRTAPKFPPLVYTVKTSVGARLLPPIGSVEARNESDETWDSSREAKEYAGAKSNKVALPCGLMFLPGLNTMSPPDEPVAPVSRFRVVSASAANGSADARAARAAACSSLCIKFSIDIPI